MLLLLWNFARKNVRRNLKTQNFLKLFFCYRTRAKYGEAREQFTYSMSLVFFQCLVNTFFALAFIYISGSSKFKSSGILSSKLDTTSNFFYIFSAFSYLTAMVSSNMALQHVSYPTQVIAKSCKPIPVMIIGVLYAKKRYPLLKYLFVFLIVLGVGTFMYNPSKSSSGSKGTTTSLIWVGELLLMFSLVMDGFTGAIQVNFGRATKYI